MAVLNSLYINFMIVKLNGHHLLTMLITKKAYTHEHILSIRRATGVCWGGKHVCCLFLCSLFVPSSFHSQVQCPFIPSAVWMANGATCLSSYSETSGSSTQAMPFTKMNSLPSTSRDLLTCDFAPMFSYCDFFDNLSYCVSRHLPLIIHLQTGFTLG